MSSFPASFFWSYSLKRNPFSLDNRLKGFYYGLFLTCAGTCRIGLLFLFYFFHRLEVEGGGVQAVAKAGGSRAVGKDVAQVGITPFAQHFGTAHAEADVRFFCDVFIGDGLVETRPACAGIELGIRDE